MKRILIFVLSICILMTSNVGCSSRDEPPANEYTYPESLTTEYAMKNYSDMYNNYRIQYTYDNAAPEVHVQSQDKYYAIPGISTDEMLAHIEGSWWMQVGHTITLCRANNVDVEPIVDYHIKKIELYWGEYLDFVNDAHQNRESLLNDGVDMKIERIDATNDHDLIEQLKNCVIEAHGVSLSLMISKGHYGNTITRASDGACLSIRIHFEETPMITWDAYIVRTKEHYYLTLWYNRADRMDFYNIPLTEELEAYIEEQLMLMQ